MSVTATVASVELESINMHSKMLGNGEAKSQYEDFLTDSTGSENDEDEPASGAAARAHEARVSAIVSQLQSSYGGLSPRKSSADVAVAATSSSVPVTVGPEAYSIGVGVAVGGGVSAGAELPAGSIVDGWTTHFVAETRLPTDRGFYRIRAYRSVRSRPDGGLDVMEPIAMIYGSDEELQRRGRGEGPSSPSLASAVADADLGVPVRVHDQCFTSEVFGSLKCDCREQLDLAKDFIKTSSSCGILLYLQQEGRGIGLANKIAAYALQELGLDTVDANRRLGLPDDARSYGPVASILADLAIGRVVLLTNNPRKISELGRLGVNVVARVRVVVPTQQYNVGYLQAKARRMDHLLPEHGAPSAAALP